MTSAKRLFFLALALLGLCMLAGCSIGSADALYSLPQQSEDDLELQKLLEAELSEGCEYSAPTSGNYMQSVQFYDLDNNGADEALAFFRDENQIPKICIYALRETQYQLVSVINGEGSSVGAVEYADLNNNGFSDLIVTWQESTGIRILDVYSMADFCAEKLLSIDCTGFAVSNLTQSDAPELVVLTLDKLNGSTAALYAFDPAGNSSATRAVLSSNMESFDLVRTAPLQDGGNALYIEGRCNNGTGIITDILVSVRGVLKNITFSASARSSGTERDILLYARDIDNDKALEVPFRAAVQPETSSSGPEVALLDWYSFSSSGEKHCDVSTLQCESDSWYLALPENLQSGLSVRASSRNGETALTLTQTEPETGYSLEIITIYTLTGSKRREKAQQDDRFILAEEGTVIYAAQLHCDSSILSRTTAAECFEIIYTEWNGGSFS